MLSATVITLLVIFVVVVLLWLVGMFYLNDFSVPGFELPVDKHALVVFPHPDDETNVAGTIWGLTHRHCQVSIAVLTQGECGTPDAHFDSTLGARRCQEMKHVANLLGAQQLIQENFGDGKLAGKMRVLETYIEQLIATEQPDIVISYDLAGLYGHPDHIACAEALHKVLKKKFPGIGLWYTTWPKRQLAIAKLPERMAKDSGFKSKRAVPTMRIFVGFGLIAQIRGTYAHKSQRTSFSDSIPHHVPLWFVKSLRLFEYFEQVR